MLSTDFQEALRVALDAKKVAYGSREVELIGRINWFLGYCYRLNKQDLYAFDHYLGALRAYKRMDDYASISQLEDNLGNVAFDNGSFETAIMRWEGRLDVVKEADLLSDLGDSFRNLGRAYYKSHQLRKSLDSYWNAKSVIADSSALSFLYNDIANSYFALSVDSSFSTLDSAMYYFNLSKSFNAKDADWGAVINNNMGNALIHLGDYDSAIGYLNKAVAVNEANNNINRLILNNNNLGIAHYHLNKVDTSFQLFMNNLSLYGHDGDVKRQFEKGIARNVKGDLGSTFHYLDSLRLKSEEYSEIYVNQIEAYKAILKSWGSNDESVGLYLIDVSNREYEREIRYNKVLKRFLIMFLVLSIGSLFYIAISQYIRYVVRSSSK
jgi:tetratricopeptide (TPR) repeat protein